MFWVVLMKQRANSSELTLLQMVGQAQYVTNWLRDICIAIKGGNFNMRGTKTSVKCTTTIYPLKKFVYISMTIYFNRFYYRTKIVQMKVEPGK